jgi:hypothetical protein
MTSIKPLKDDVFVSIFFHLYIQLTLKHFVVCQKHVFAIQVHSTLNTLSKKYALQKEKKVLCTNNNKNQQLKCYLQQIQSTQRSITVIDVSKEDLPVIDFVTSTK